MLAGEVANSSIGWLVTLEAVVDYISEKNGLEAAQPNDGWIAQPGESVIDYISEKNGLEAAQPNDGWIARPGEYTKVNEEEKVMVKAESQLHSSFISKKGITSITEDDASDPDTFEGPMSMSDPDTCEGPLSPWSQSEAESLLSPVAETFSSNADEKINEDFLVDAYMARIDDILVAALNPHSSNEESVGMKQKLEAELLKGLEDISLGAATRAGILKEVARRTAAIEQKYLEELVTARAPFPGSLSSSGSLRHASQCQGSDAFSKDARGKNTEVQRNVTTKAITADTRTKELKIANDAYVSEEKEQKAAKLGESIQVDEAQKVIAKAQSQLHLSLNSGSLAVALNTQVSGGHDRKCFSVKQKLQAGLLKGLADGSLCAALGTAVPKANLPEGRSSHKTFPKRFEGNVSDQDIFNRPLSLSSSGASILRELEFQNRGTDTFSNSDDFALSLSSSGASILRELDQNRETDTFSNSDAKIIKVPTNATTKTITAEASAKENVYVSEEKKQKAAKPGESTESNEEDKMKVKVQSQLYSSKCWKLEQDVGGATAKECLGVKQKLQAGLLKGLDDGSLSVALRTVMPNQDAPEQPAKAQVMLKEDLPEQPAKAQTQCSRSSAPNSARRGFGVRTLAKQKGHTSRKSKSSPKRWVRRFPDDMSDPVSLSSSSSGGSGHADEHQKGSDAFSSNGDLESMRTVPLLPDAEIIEVQRDATANELEVEASSKETKFSTVSEKKEQAAKPAEKGESQSTKSIEEEEEMVRAKARKALKSTEATEEEKVRAKARKELHLGLNLGSLAAALNSQSPGASILKCLRLKQKVAADLSKGLKDGSLSVALRQSTARQRQN